MNAPNPVCTSARKKTNQSRARRLTRDGTGEALLGGSPREGAAGALAASRGDSLLGSRAPKKSDMNSLARRRPSERWSSRRNERSNAAALRLRAWAADHDDRLRRLVDRRHPQLIFRQIDDDRARLLGVEMQRAPVNGDLAGADTQKTAKIDDRGSDLASAINEDVDNAPHVVARGAKRFNAENALELLPVDNRGRNAGLLFLGVLVILRGRRGGGWLRGRRGGGWLRGRVRLRRRRRLS